MQGTAIFKIKCGTEVVQVVPNWWYRKCTGGGPERDISRFVWYRNGQVPKRITLWSRNGLVPNATYPIETNSTSMLVIFGLSHFAKKQVKTFLFTFTKFF